MADAEDDVEVSADKLNEGDYYDISCYSMDE